MLAEIYGRNTGCCGGKGGSMHLIDRSVGFTGAVPIVGSTIPIAVGTALTSKMQGKPIVTLVFFGEGATEEGVFHESMNFASVWKLPVVFICENNLYSVYTPLSARQPSHREVFAQAGAHGIEGHRADGNDLRAIYHHVHEAVAKARQGKGPTFLEFETYRWLEHCGPNYDNDIGYRSPGEYERWKVRCPLDRARQLLTTQGILAPEQEDQWRREIAEEIQSAVEFAKASPFPAKEALTTHLFA
jgi:pyruvate dehydrogenase E1 component alpha subunit